MSDEYTRCKVSKRRKDTFKKKEKDKRDAKYSFFVKYEHTPCLVQYTNVLVPERRVEVPTYYFDYFGNIRNGKTEERIYPEHIFEKKKYIDLPEKTVIRRADISNRRKDAKKYTNRTLRREKPIYEVNGWEMYVEVVDNKPVIRYRYLDADWDYKYDCRGSGYRKAFDYRWYIW